MPVIVVANPKGGVGKSTLCTNLAGWLARQGPGRQVMLGDLDRQHSSRLWLGLRPATLPAIRSWEADGDALRLPKGTTDAVIDTPAGLHGKRLELALKLADRLLIPLQPSPFDIAATHGFIQQLRAHKRGASLKLALVAMRVKEHTHATEHLHEWLDALQLPVLTHLRDTQNYVHLAARGLTLWDVAPTRVERDLAQWQPITDWLKS